MSERPIIGVKLLIPEMNPAGEQRYFVVRRSSEKDGRDWDLPGGRAEPTDLNATAVAQREGREELGYEDLGRPVPIALQRIIRPGLSDVMRFTTVVDRQDPDDFDPKLSGEHMDGDWMTRREILDVHTDDQLPHVMVENGPVHQLEYTGNLQFGADAIERVVRRLRLLG